MTKGFSICCAFACAVASISVLAQSGPLQIEGTARKVAEVPTYADSDGKKRAQPLAVSKLQFPLRAFEETPTGMARIRAGDADAWIALEDFKVSRNVQADCNFVMPTTTTGANRGANEGCVGTKKK